VGVRLKTDVFLVRRDVKSLPGRLGALYWDGGGSKRWFWILALRTWGLWLKMRRKVTFI
jgi:hypothetical protein